MKPSMSVITKKKAGSGSGSYHAPGGARKRRAAPEGTGH
jgi:hypothetical protein